MLRDAADGFHPQPPRLAGGPRPEPVEQVLRWGRGEGLSAEPGIVVELAAQGRSVGHQLGASLLGGLRLQRSPRGLGCLDLELGELFLVPLDRAG